MITLDGLLVRIVRKAFGRWRFEATDFLASASILKPPSTYRFEPSAFSLPSFCQLLFASFRIPYSEIKSPLRLGSAAGITVKG